MRRVRGAWQACSSGGRAAVQTLVMEVPIFSHDCVRRSYNAVAEQYAAGFRDELGAAIAFYSIIHLEPGELRRAFIEIHRVLRPDGLFLVSFHAGSEVRHLDRWWDHQVDVDFRFFQPSVIAEALGHAGFRPEMRLERVSYPGKVETRRAYLLARRHP